MSVEVSELRDSITFRPETDDDRQFIYRVYRSTREPELQLVPWSEEEKEGFCRQQLAAQRYHYDKMYEGAEYLVILRDGEPAGRLYLHSVEDSLLVLDISLMPEQRGFGIGGMIMRDLMEQAAGKNQIVTIHVEQYNPAMHLYDRLGFKPVDHQGVYYLMEWRPEERKTSE